MKEGYIPGAPDDLEAQLRRIDEACFSVERTNIQRDQVITAIQGYVTIPQRVFPKTPVAESTQLREMYFFFPPSEDARLIPLWDSWCVVPLRLDCYGFSEEAMDMQPERISLELSAAAETQYRRIVGMRKIGIADLLETVGFITNDSMRYDFDKIIAIDRELGNDTAKWEQMRMGYTQSSREVTSGICTDAGNSIRKILSSLNIEKRFAFLSVGVTGVLRSHNTTLFFDRDTSRWAVINSKSPTKVYNLVPKERLGELGYPYAA